MLINIHINQTNLAFLNKSPVLPGCDTPRFKHGMSAAKRWMTSKR